MLKQEEINQYIERFPILEEIMALKPVTWMNNNTVAMKDFHASMTLKDMEEAEELWDRFRPFFVKEFPETREMDGVIESPLTEIPNMKKALEEKFGEAIPGKLYLKCDNDLSIAGSVKARGGFFEVLHYAEKLAKEAGLIDENENYEQFGSDKFKKFFSDYRIGVGSTGNLGLSIGIMSAKLGFNVNVYMSRDAKQWKKDLLREKGATVHEFDGDFGIAINAGREETNADPKGYFVDDESSGLLYQGYSTAGFRIKRQIEEQGITVDEDHPLFLHLPCGVGGAPGGVAFGMKQLFGDHVHCFFVEPTHSPSVLIGLLTGEMSNICVQDFGIDNKTEADGLAVGRPSTFATKISDQIISAIYTIEDEMLYELLSELYDTEKIFIEPSATAGLIGPQRISQTDYLAERGINPENITHIALSTGGGLIPEKEREEFYERGKRK